MSDNDTPTWYDAEHDAQVAALECYADSVANDHGTDGDDAAHEHADGTLDVIYTWRARAIWSESQHVQECEDQLPDYGVDESADIDRRITLCVYIAIREAYAMAWRKLEGIGAPTHATPNYHGNYTRIIESPVKTRAIIIDEGAVLLGLRDTVTA